MFESSVAWSGKVWEKNRYVSHRRGISIASATAVNAMIPAKTARMLRVQPCTIREEPFSASDDDGADDH
jgi:hypothetical protein